MSGSRSFQSAPSQPTTMSGAGRARLPAALHGRRRRGRADHEKGRDQRGRAGGRASA